MSNRKASTPSTRSSKRLSNSILSRRNRGSLCISSSSCEGETLPGLSKNNTRINAKINVFFDSCIFSGVCGTFLFNRLSDRKIITFLVSFISYCFSKTYHRQKYKALISKYKAHILKYMACIFYDKPCVFSHIPKTQVFFPQIRRKRTQTFFEKSIYHCSQHTLNKVFRHTRIYPAYFD